MGQYPVPSSAATVIFTIPPGASSTLFYCTASTMYVGMSTAVTATNGYAVPSTPAAFQAFPTSTGQKVYAFNSGAGTVTINFICSTGA
jgi:hypothetical protein